MKKVYTQLSMEERTMIQTQLEIGFNPAAIAAGLNPSPSTIMRDLDLPYGRTAFFSEHFFDRYKWIGEHTKPGGLFYEPLNPTFCFAFHLKNPTPMYLIRDSGYTPLFQVEAVVRALESSPPMFIAWPRKWTKPADSRAPDDNLEILWQFMSANYELHTVLKKPAESTEHMEGDIEMWKLKN